MTKYLLAISAVLSLVLTGCMLPSQERAGNDIAYEEQIESVQSAVEQYQESTGGLLPIKTVENDTPMYRKYQIDFSLLKPRFMADLPGNAYENGGVFQYTLLDVEENPTVYVFDLRVAETIRSLQIRIQANRGIPFEGQVGNNMYSIDFSQLGYDEDPVVTSPYTGNELPLVARGDGTVYVDYITDLYQLTQDMDQSAIQDLEDLRPILFEGSRVVPAYSVPYYIGDDGEIKYGQEETGS
ncbi:hypothetical protein KP77_21520 [Jeotgalibacillus alimentarius]|uniref:ABC transporter periplasmic binding protein yphF n=1 Tax=Jeotgalibacillus alimentarius TaxID=135826 RepID=A0A0C2VX15_9BACL|nr:hypothetical protein [Jeotgalibacillus alimentarius]KIL48941.1 hypothetical protein KP77_21520 [Jeotgalibacillus alimentarius]